MKISNSYIFDQAIRTLQSRQSQLNRVEQQIASGLKVTKASDDPTVVNPLQRLYTLVSRQDTFERNLNSLSDRLSAEESVVTSSISALDRIRELTIAGINDTNQQGVDRGAIASELDELIEQLRAFANTQDVNGNYLFAGSRVSTPPFQVDSAGRTVYMGDQYRNKVPVGEGRELQGNRPANEVFVKIVREREGGAPEPVSFFRSLEELSTAMRAGSSDLSSRVQASVQTGPDGSTPQLVLGSDQTDTGLLRLRVSGDEIAITQQIHSGGTIGIDFGEHRFNVGDTVQMNIERFVAADVPVIRAGDVDADGRLTADGMARLADAINAQTSASPGQLQRGLGEVDALFNGLINAQATIGGEQNAVERQTDLLEDSRLRTRVLLSDVQDLDYNEAVTRLRQELLSLEAFQRSFAQTTQLSLFNFIN